MNIQIVIIQRALPIANPTQRQLMRLRNLLVAKRWRIVSLIRTAKHSMIPKKIQIYKKDLRMNLKDTCIQRQINLEQMISPNCFHRSYSKDMLCSKNAVEVKLACAFFVVNNNIVFGHSLHGSNYEKQKRRVHLCRMQMG